MRANILGYAAQAAVTLVTFAGLTQTSMNVWVSLAIASLLGQLAHVLVRHVSMK